MEREPYVRTISKLVEEFEGYGTLAVVLNVNVDDLRRWAEGKSRPPADVLPKIADLAGRSARSAKSQVSWPIG